MGELEPATHGFYCDAIGALNAAEIPFLVGGAYAFARYTGIARHTKDFDVFVHPRDFDRVLTTLGEAGYRTEVPFAHWLGKAYCGDDFVDIIHSSGNAVAMVDDDWFAHAIPDEVLGRPVRLVPPEEMIWSKAFIMERERYDGADIVHILRACAPTLDWDRLLRRFGPYWRVLLSHVVLFGFVYPGQRRQIPDRVINTLTGRLAREQARDAPALAGEPLCQGPLLSRAQYVVDVDQWGYRDARLAPLGNMTEAEKEVWTAAAEEEVPLPKGGLAPSDRAA
jgi:putative nucleotidyltransferase-like protein